MDYLTIRNLKVEKIKQAVKQKIKLFGRENIGHHNIVLLIIVNQGIGAHKIKLFGELQLVVFLIEIGHGFQSDDLIAALQGKSVGIVRDQHVGHGDGNGKSSVIFGVGELDAGDDIVAVLQLKALDTGFHVNMNGAGKDAADLDELIFRHILGSPVGKFDDEADLLNTGSDIVGGDLLAVFIGVGNVFSVLAVIPEPYAPVGIVAVRAVIV